MLRMKNFRREILSACIVGALCACVAKGDGFRIEDGKIVVDSPFDLEIGSPEYAKALGSAVKSHKDVRKDDKSGETVTNWYHSGEARFAQPYFGARNAWLSFNGDDKALSSVHFWVGDRKTSFGGSLTFSECCKLYEEIAADISRRLGEEVDTDDDVTEDVALGRIGEDALSRNESGKNVDVVAYSFRHANSFATNEYGIVQYSLAAMIYNDKTYSVSLGVNNWRDFYSSASPSRDDGHIPVYTNKPHAVDLSLRTPEQEKAHREADALRATIKRVFGVALDAPSSTNDMHCAQ